MLKSSFERGERRQRFRVGLEGIVKGSEELSISTAP